MIAPIAAVSSGRVTTATHILECRFFRLSARIALISNVIPPLALAFFKFFLEQNKDDNASYKQNNKGGKIDRVYHQCA